MADKPKQNDNVIGLYDELPDGTAGAKTLKELINKLPGHVRACVRHRAVVLSDEAMDYLIKLENEYKLAAREIYTFSSAREFRADSMAADAYDIGIKQLEDDQNTPEF